MKNIFANNDKTKYAIVDDDVFEIIQEMGLKFCIDKRENKGYFISTSHMIKLPGMTEKKQLRLHVFVWILKTGDEPSSEIDHKDINPVNNCFSNLRLATRQEQCQHKTKRKSNTSGYIGVCHHHINGKYKDKTYENDYWRADIMRPEGKRETKTFPYTDKGLLEAVRWRDVKVKQYHGEFAVTNFPDENQ